MLPDRNERGSGTVLTLGLALGVLTAALVGVLWAVVSIGHHRADAAADLVALSAAQALQADETAACRTAQRIAAAHSVDLTRCRVDGEVVSIAVGVRLRMGVIGAPMVTAEARAGPVGAN
jgi:secretion/DNA translocation related TadE-like protein